MGRLWIDHDTADRLLDGRLEPEDAPPGYAEVTRLVRSVSAQPSSEELMTERMAIAAATLVVRNQPAHRLASAPRRFTVRSLLRLKVGGLVVAGTLVGSTGLAFAGVLPDPAQDAASHILSKIGVSVPEGHPASTGDEISGIATLTDATGVDKGAEISSTASGGMSQAGEHGAPASINGATPRPPVTTPNDGGTGTANTASGGASEVGTGTADGDSQGHSAEGSGIATSTPDPGATP